MKNLLVAFLFVYSHFALASSNTFAKSRMCKSTSQLAQKLRDPKKLIDEAKNGEYSFADKAMSKISREEFAEAKLASFERARNIALEFPVSKELGFDLGNPLKKKPFKCERIKKSCLYNEICGWTVSGPHGKMILRLDCPHQAIDAKTGLPRKDINGNLMPEPAHFNIEYHIDSPVVKHNLKKGSELNYKLMFDCNGRVCNEDDVRLLAHQMRH